VVSANHDIIWLSNPTLFKELIMTKSKQLLSVAISASALLFSISGANAAGFYIQEQSVKGLGAAFSGSATSIDDASTIFFNPAGMTKLDGMQGNLGVHLLIPDADLTDNGSNNVLGRPVGENPDNPYDPTPVPNAYFAAPLELGGNLFWAGIGISAPFGLSSDYGETSFVRFDSTETELRTINVAPSAAFAINDMISIGGGVDIQYADAELKSIVSNGVTEGPSTLEGDDISVGYNLGVQFKPRTDTEIGLHYRSAISHTLEGNIKVENVAGLNFDESGSADLDLPDIATLGIAHDVTDRFRVMGQATWFGWSNFKEIQAVRDDGVAVPNVEQDYQNTYAIAIGAEYDLNNQWTIRGGYQFDETPTTNEFRTSRTPDGDRNWFSGGATYKLNEKLSLDMAATYIDVDEGTINVSRNGGAANVIGNTEGSVGILAVGLNYKF